MTEKSRWENLHPPPPPHQGKAILFKLPNVFILVVRFEQMRMRNETAWTILNSLYTSFLVVRLEKIRMRIMIVFSKGRLLSLWYTVGYMHMHIQSAVIRKSLLYKVYCKDLTLTTKH